MGQTWPASSADRTGKCRRNILDHREPPATRGAATYRHQEGRGALSGPGHRDHRRCGATEIGHGPDPTILSCRCCGVGRRIASLSQPIAIRDGPRVRCSVPDCFSTSPPGVRPAGSERANTASRPAPGCSRQPAPPCHSPRPEPDQRPGRLRDRRLRPTFRPVLACRTPSHEVAGNPRLCRRVARLREQGPSMRCPIITNPPRRPRATSPR